MVDDQTAQEALLSLSFDGEEWREVVGYEGLYSVSSMGRVASRCRFKSVRIMHTGNRPYALVQLFKDKECASKLVHRLVLEAFRGPCPEGMECSHINGHSRDNRLSNLEWTTPAINLSMRRIHGTMPLGERGGSILPDADVAEILRLRSEVRPPSAAELARRYGVRVGYIYELSHRSGMRPKVSKTVLVVLLRECLQLELPDDLRKRITHACDWVVP